MLWKEFTVALSWGCGERQRVNQVIDFEGSQRWFRLTSSPYRQPKEGQDELKKLGTGRTGYYLLTLIPLLFLLVANPPDSRLQSHFLARAC